MQDNQRQTQFAYIAGVMDSDGCFMITKHKRKTKNLISERALAFPKKVDQWAFTYLPCLKISMIEPEAVEFIKRLGYGSIYLTGARKNRPNSKSIYTWYLRDLNLLDEMLRGIVPYLKVKKNRAQFLLEYNNHRGSYKNPCYRGVGEDELKYREEMYLKMRQLNGTKVAATTKSLGRESASDSLTS